MSPRRSIILVLIALGLTLAYLIGIGFNLTPWLRGPEEWRWAYVVPGSLERLWLPLLVLTGYLVFIGWWQIRGRNRLSPWLVVLIAAIMTGVVQLALLYLEHPDVRSQLFYRTVSETSGGFFNVGAVVTDTADFLTNFADRMASYPIHPQRHPPGLPLLFAWARQFFDHNTGIATVISQELRPFQCQNLPLMNLPNSAIASASIQMLIPIWVGLVVFPLYYLGNLLYDQDTALRAVILWPLVPSIALWATRWNQLYGIFTLLIFILIYLGLTRRSLPSFLIAGFLFGFSLFFSFGNAVIIGFLGVYGLIWLLTSEERPTLGWLSAAVIFFGSGLIAFGLILFLFGINLISIWQQAISTHFDLGRGYATWLFFHLYDFFVFLGIPLLVAWLVATIAAFKSWRHGQIDSLCVSFVIALLLLDLSGTSQGEVARVWAFLLPLALLIAVRLFLGNGKLFVAFTALLTTQLFISNIFLRPVGTGLTDPPLPPPNVAGDEETIAAWRGGPVLRSVQYDQQVEAGQPIPIVIIWDTIEPIDRPYSVFVHLLDPSGNLVAQYDGLPFDGQWLTTCWQVGFPIADQYKVQLPDEIAPGEYQLNLGLYRLPSGERLGITSPTGIEDRSLPISQVTITKSQ